MDYIAAEEYRAGILAVWSRLLILHNLVVHAIREVTKLLQSAWAIVDTQRRISHIRYANGSS